GGARGRASDGEALLADRLAQHVHRPVRVARERVGGTGGDAQSAVLAARRVDRRALVVERDRVVRTGIGATAAFAVAKAVAGAPAGAEGGIGGAHRGAVRNCCRGGPCSQVFFGITNWTARPPGGSALMRAITRCHASIPPSTASTCVRGCAAAIASATARAAASVSATTTTVAVGLIMRSSR